MKKTIVFAGIAAAFCAFSASEDEWNPERWASDLLNRDFIFFSTPATPEARREAAEAAKRRQCATGEASKIPDRRHRHRESQADVNRRYNAVVREIEATFTNNLAQCEREWMQAHVGSRREDFAAWARSVSSNAHVLIARKFPALGVGE